MTTRLYIDGDVLLYRVGFSCQHKVHCVSNPAGEILGTFDTKAEAEAFVESNSDLGDLDVGFYHESEDEYVAKGRLNEVLRRFLPSSQHWQGPVWEHVVVVTSGSHNFRNQVAMTRPYKGNRKAPKPVHWEMLKHFLTVACTSFGFTHVKAVGEADDYLATCAQPGTKEHNYEDADWIGSNDKDFRQVANVYLWDWTKGDIGEPSFDVVSMHTEESAFYFLLKQVLTGDPVDNITGIPGIGEKKAAQLLSLLGASWKTVYESYVVHYNDTELAWMKFLETVRLIYLQRKFNEVFTPEVGNDA